MLVQEPISLRFLKKSDLDFLFKIENDKSLWRYGSEKKTTLGMNYLLILKILIFR